MNGKAQHPVSLVRDERIPGVFFTGWRGHDELPTGLGCADVFVSPSVGEAFGQVFIEAMACGLPVVAAASGGPLSFVNDNPATPNGWLVTPDDEEALRRGTRPGHHRPHRPHRAGQAGLPTPWHRSAPGSPGRAQHTTSPSSTTRSAPLRPTPREAERTGPNSAPWTRR